VEYDIFGCYYGHSFELLSKVWKASLEENCPTAGVELDADMPLAPPVKYERYSAVANVAKLARWRERLYTARRPVLFLDIDTLCRRDLSPVWGREFDVAYTWRPARRGVIGGFIAARPSAAARSFFDRWLCRAATLLTRPVELHDLMYEAGGLNQQVLSELVADPPGGARVEKLSPYEWNLCDEVWGDFEPGLTRLVHVKGALREEVLERRLDGENSEIVKEWWTYFEGVKV